MRQRRTLYSDDWVNPPGRYNNYQMHIYPTFYIYTKETLTELKG